MYLIIKHGFDSLENELGNAIYTDNVGYVTKEEDADIWIASQKRQQYKGWDGRMYPYYTKERIEELVI